jgi:hypothetical protein
VGRPPDPGPFPNGSTIEAVTKPFGREHNGLRCAIRHLDASKGLHHDVNVRTTLTIDDDLAAQLREEAARQGLPFRQVLNRTLRLGLRAASGAAPRQRFEVEARRLGIRAGVDPAKLNQLADELEDEEILPKHTAWSGRAGPPGGA